MTEPTPMLLMKLESSSLRGIPSVSLRSKTISPGGVAHIEGSNQGGALRQDQ